MMHMTKEDRQRLIAEYAKRNGGVFDPAGFMREVQEQGKNHPAFDWFTWDDTAAAENWRVEQARRFAQGLKVIFEIQQVGGGTVRIGAPALISPIENRKDGGGYKVMSLSDRDLDELRSQALMDLRSWERRYSIVLLRSQLQVNALRSDIEKGRSAAW